MAPKNNTIQSDQTDPQTQKGAKINEWMNKGLGVVNGLSGVLDTSLQASRPNDTTWYRNYLGDMAQRNNGNYYDFASLGSDAASSVLMPRLSYADTRGMGGRGVTMEKVGAVGSGFMNGLQAGKDLGWPAALALGVAGAGAATAGILFGDNAGQAQYDLNLASADQTMDINKGNIGAGLNQVNQWKHNNYAVNSMAEGGSMRDYNTNGGYFAPLLVSINNGKTHEQNRFGGVPYGADNNGIPNLVEEGEQIFGDYVFSQRLRPSKSDLLDAGFPESIANKYANGGKLRKTFAEIATDFDKGLVDNPNDNIERNAANVMLTKLQDAQEIYKQRLEERRLRKQLNSMSPEELIDLGAQMQAMQPVPQEQYAQLPEEQIYEPQGMMAPGMLYPEQQMFAFGGRFGKAKRIVKGVVRAVKDISKETKVATKAASEAAKSYREERKAAEAAEAAKVTEEAAKVDAAAAKSKEAAATAETASKEIDLKKRDKKNQWKGAGKFGLVSAGLGGATIGGYKAYNSWWGGDIDQYIPEGTAISQLDSLYQNNVADQFDDLPNSEAYGGRLKNTPVGVARSYDFPGYVYRGPNIGYVNYPIETTGGGDWLWNYQYPQEDSYLPEVFQSTYSGFNIPAPGIGVSRSTFPRIGAGRTALGIAAGNNFYRWNNLRRPEDALHYSFRTFDAPSYRDLGLIGRSESGEAIGPRLTTTSGNLGRATNTAQTPVAPASRNFVRTDLSVANPLDSSLDIAHAGDPTSAPYVYTEPEYDLGVEGAKLAEAVRAKNGLSNTVDVEKYKTPVQEEPDFDVRTNPRSRWADAGIYTGALTNAGMFLKNALTPPNYQYANEVDAIGRGLPHQYVSIRQPYNYLAYRPEAIDLAPVNAAYTAGIRQTAGYGPSAVAVMPAMLHAYNTNAGNVINATIGRNLAQKNAVNQANNALNESEARNSYTAQLANASMEGDRAARAANLSVLGVRMRDAEDTARAQAISAAARNTAADITNAARMQYTIDHLINPDTSLLWGYDENNMPIYVPLKSTGGLLKKVPITITKKNNK